MKSISYRVARAGDTDGMLELLAPGMLPHPDVTACVPRIWRQWLDSGEMQARVIERARADGSRRIEAFGAAVLVEEAFVHQQLSSPCPFLASRVYQLAADGASPVMSLARVAKDNWTSGLNLLILHYCQRAPDESDASFEQILTIAHAAFRDTTEGYNLNLLWQEAFSPEERAFLEAGGMRVICDYADNGDRFDDTGDATLRPCLMGLTRADAAQGFPGSTASFCFQSREPVFHFTLAQQRVLELALQGDSDADISRALGVSSDAVKQTWRAIYERVNSNGGEALIGSVEQGEAFTNHHRRRLLLNYLRTHPEERRPVCRPRGH